MTTAATADDEMEIVEMEIEDTESAVARFLTPARALIAFIVLAGIAIIALVIAILAVVLAPANAGGLIVTALIILAIVIIIEVVLLLLAKPRKA